jgi:tetratricopeptide (TPR) repeat protein/TolB-like protein
MARARRWLRQRPAAVALGGAAVIAALVAAGIWRWTRSDAMQGIGASGRPSIAVLSFDAPGASADVAWLAKGIPSMLVTGLAQTPGLDVISTERIDEISRGLGQKDQDALDRSQVLDVGRKSGAGALVAGSVFKTGPTVRIDVQVQEVASGRIMSAYSVNGADVFPLVDELTNRIRDSLSMAAPTTLPSVAEVTSSNLEAYRLYVEGLDAFVNLRHADARKLLEQALQLDPAFASSMYFLSLSANFQGDRAAAEKYRQELRSHLDRLPERLRFSVQAEDALRASDPAKGTALLETLIARYPDAAGGYVQLSNIYGRQDPEKALDVLARGIKALPNLGALRNTYGYAFLALGRYPEAIREFETYTRLEPKEPNPLDSLAEAYLISGQPEKALDTYSRALEVDPTFHASHWGRAVAYGMLGRYDEALEELSKQRAILARSGLPATIAAANRAYFLSRVGRYREAEQELREGERMAEQYADALNASRIHRLAGVMSLERNDYLAALQHLKKTETDLARIGNPAERADVEVSLLFLLGMSEIRAGRLSDARGRLEKQRKIYNPGIPVHTWHFRVLEGEIALAAGDLPAAEAAFTASEPAFKPAISAQSFGHWPFRDGLARVKAARGDLKGAIDIYRQLITPDISQKWTTILEPRFVFELAKLLEQSGDRAGARAQYERFLQLWKRADSGLADLQEARRRLKQR